MFYLCVSLVHQYTLVNGNLLDIFCVCGDMEWCIQTINNGATDSQSNDLLVLDPDFQECLKKKHLTRTSHRNPVTDIDHKANKTSTASLLLKWGGKLGQIDTWLERMCKWSLKKNKNSHNTIWTSTARSLKFRHKHKNLWILGKMTNR